MRKIRLAYYLIADASGLDEFRDETCKRFPEHVTIRGRFIAHDSAIADLVAAGREVFRILPPFAAELHGPRVFGSGLTWYELSDDASLVAILRAIHEQLNHKLIQSGLIEEDEVPGEHSGDSFTPHMTLAFNGVDAARIDCAPSRMQVRFVEWGLFRYDEWETSPRLRCVFGEHLHAEPSAPAHHVRSSASLLASCFR